MSEDSFVGFTEPDRYLDSIVHEVIGAAIEVHRLIGPGFLEAVYRDCLDIELGIRDISHLREQPVSLMYKEQLVGKGRLDFLVCDRLIVEIKAVESLVLSTRLNCFLI